jgi:hypothetical protein
VTGYSLSDDELDRVDELSARVQKLTVQRVEARRAFEAQRVVLKGQQSTEHKVFATLSSIGRQIVNLEERIDRLFQRRRRRPIGTSRMRGESRCGWCRTVLRPKFSVRTRWCSKTCANRGENAQLVLLRPNP